LEPPLPVTGYRKSCALPRISPFYTHSSLPRYLS
jgi:hypothetical protein